MGAISWLWAKAGTSRVRATNLSRAGDTQGGQQSICAFAAMGGQYALQQRQDVCALE